LVESCGLSDLRWSSEGTVILPSLVLEGTLILASGAALWIQDAALYQFQF
jgi:hypothetical protein